MVWEAVARGQPVSMRLLAMPSDRDKLTLANFLLRFRL